MKKQITIFILLLTLIIFQVNAKNSKIHPALPTTGNGLVDVIVEYKDTISSDYFHNIGCTTGHVLKSLSGIAARCPAQVLSQIASQDDVVYVWEDTILYPMLDSTVSVINASAVWPIFGNGTGINVSIIDTGINTSHPALAGQVILEKDFTPENITDDRCNHGTAVACIVGCINNTYKGVAPGAKIFNAKAGRVINFDQIQCGFLTSDTIAAIDWSIENHAQVIQMTMGSPSPSCYQNAIAVAVNNSGKNVTIVISAGNFGPGNQSIAVPGCAENALTVGATTHDGSAVDSYSSRGPTDYGLQKPDLVAPGSFVTAATNNGGFSQFSGTSFSAPHVAGVVALMLQLKRLRPSEVKNITKSTAISLGYEENVQGSGRVDAYAAVLNVSLLPATFVLNVSEVFKDPTTPPSQVRINSTIRNEGNSQVNITSMRIVVPAGVQIVSPGETQNTGNIPGLEQQRVSWIINATAAGNYTITVVANASNANEVNRSLVVEFFGPNMTTTPQIPTGNKVAQNILVNATVINNGDVPAENTTLTLSVPANITIIDAATKSLGSIMPGASATTSWIINASRSGNYLLTFTRNASNAAGNITNANIVVDVTTFGTVLQPDATAGKDAYLVSNKATTNYGVSDPIKVASSGPQQRALIEWNLTSIPSDASVVNALVVLYVPTVESTVNATVDVYRLTQSWIEGTGNGQQTGDGVTWKTYDGVNNWVNAGGDYDTTTIWASTNVDTAGRTYTWNTTGLVASWHNNTYANKGMIMISQGTSRKDMTSSDSTNTTARPKLELNYTL